MVNHGSSWYGEFQQSCWQWKLSPVPAAIAQESEGTLQITEIGSGMTTECVQFTQLSVENMGH